MDPLSIVLVHAGLSTYINSYNCHLSDSTDNRITLEIIETMSDRYRYCLAMAMKADPEACIISAGSFRSNANK